MRYWLERMRPVFEGEGAGSGAAGGGEGAASGAAGGSTALGAGEAKPDAPVSAADALYGSTALTAPDDKPKEGEIIEPGKEADTGKAGAADGWKEYENDPAKTDEENAAAKAEHDKTKPAEKKEGDEKPKLKAEDIDLTPPEGFQVDDAVAEEFKQFVIDGGFTKDQVETLKGMQVKLYEKQTEAHAETVAKWGEELKTNKEFGGAELPQNLGFARQAIREFFPVEAKQMLDATGLGNHPAFVAGFVRMGKAMSEGGSFTGRSGEGSATLVDAMYGNS